MCKLIIITFIILSSCSSTAESKAKWYDKGVAPSLRKWRHCTTELDGPSFHEKGICYKKQRCIKKWMRKERCETILIYCAYGDIPCIRKNYFPYIKKRGTI